MKKKNSIISLTLISMLLLATITTTHAEEPRFKDVPEQHWAYDAIMSISQSGLITGFRDGSFRPAAKVTREQFAVAFVRTLGIPLDKKAPQIFSDVPRGHWSFLYIDAIKPYISTPSNPMGYFNFNGGYPISREEVAHAIALALDLNKGQPPKEDFLTTKFKDHSSISSEYRAAVNQVAYYRLLTGDAKGDFNAKANLSRAELAVVLHKLQQNKPAIMEALRPVRKPWTIEMINFQRPDYEMVQDFPGYNQIQRFFGTVYAKVYGFHNSHLVAEYRFTEQIGNMFVSKAKTVFVYVYEDDLNSFAIGDKVFFDYDRNNNIISYEFLN